MESSQISWNGPATGIEPFPLATIGSQELPDPQIIGCNKSGVTYRIVVTDEGVAMNRGYGWMWTEWQSDRPKDYDRGIATLIAQAEQWESEATAA